MIDKQPNSRVHKMVPTCVAMETGDSYQRMSNSTVSLTWNGNVPKAKDHVSREARNIVRTDFREVILDEDWHTNSNW